ncbi:MAG: hypothetical protein Kow0090_07190 [Myxococcota bacterium]
MKRKMKIDEKKVVMARLPWDFTGLLASGSPHPRDIIWHLRFLYAAAILRNLGYKSVIIDGHLKYLPASELAQKIINHRPEILLLDVATPDIPYAIRLAEIVKPRLPKTKIWALGQHPSFSSEQLLAKNSHIDGCLKGEIYEPLAALANGTSGKNIPGASVKNGDKIVSIPPHSNSLNPDALPLIDPSLLDLDAYRMFSVHAPSFKPVRWGFLQTSWGCPFSCRFCSQTLRVSFGKKWTGQSAERVADDMQRLSRDYNISAFYFMDDIVTLDMKRIIELSELIIKKRLKLFWAFQTYEGYLDEKILPMLKRAGCVAIKFGVESGDPDILAQSDKRVSLENAERLAKAIKRAGISLTAYYMIGFPGETKEQMEKTFRIAKKIDSDMIQVAIYTPYPTSRGFDELPDDVKKELLDYPQRFSHYNSFLPINLSAVSDEELLDFQRDFYFRYYLSPKKALKYLWKRGRYTIPQGTDSMLIIRTLGYLLNRVP